MNAIVVGCTVRALDEDLQGNVVRIKGKRVFVVVDGFEMPFDAHELVVVEHDHLINESSDPPALSAKDKMLRSQGKQKLKDLGSAESVSYELDLHIEELLDHHSHLSNGEILSYQMTRCRAFIREAMEKRYPKVILIHGVGEGVLKSEIIRYLSTLDKVEFHDAPYRTYGYGATEVLIR